eukprot:4324035-Pleurochrysis_carterae.AAC.1
MSEEQLMHTADILQMVPCHVRCRLRTSAKHCAFHSAGTSSAGNIHPVPRWEVSQWSENEETQ